MCFGWGWEGEINTCKQLKLFCRSLKLSQNFFTWGICKLCSHLTGRIYPNFHELDKFTSGKLTFLLTTIAHSIFHVLVWSGNHLTLSSQLLSDWLNWFNWPSHCTVQYRPDILISGINILRSIFIQRLVTERETGLVVIFYSTLSLHVDQVDTCIWKYALWVSNIKSKQILSFQIVRDCYLMARQDPVFNFQLFIFNYKYFLQHAHCLQTAMFSDYHLWCMQCVFIYSCISLLFS